MRLAFLTHEPFFPPSGGGSAEAMYLVRELVRRGHEVHLFCPTIDDPAGVAARFRITLHEFKTFQMGRYARARNLKYLLYPAGLERLVRRTAKATRFDALLSQHTISAVAAGRLKARLGVPVVMNFLDYLTGFMETWPLPRPVVAGLNRYEMSLPRRYRADGVMTVSDVLADRFVEAGYPRERLGPIQYGFDGELFRAPQATFETTDATAVVVMHGSFDKHHLGTIAAETMVRVFSGKPQVEFRFVGRETPALTRLLTAVRYRMPGAWITHSGFVPYADVAAELARATVGLVPYEESRGTHSAFVAKLVEYLAVGIPVASTPLEAMRRHFGDEPAVKFAGFDGASLGDAVLAWLNLPAEQRRLLGRAASEQVRRELDWTVLCRNAAEFVEETVATAVRPAR